jgi:Skp family chaperone for outer membrane proteins
MTIIKHLILGTLAVAAPVAVAAPAYAQVSGIATAEPVIAIFRAKAWSAANDQIRTSFRDNLTKFEAKQGDRQKLLAQLDRNGDKQVDDGELAAQPAVKAQLDAVDKEVNDLTTPMLRAQAFALEMILSRYQEAQTAVITAKKISVILTPQAIVFSPANSDVTAAITTELDRLVPTVPITAPANWRPTEETMQVLEQLLRLQAAAAQQAAAQRQAAGAPAAAGARPAATAPAPGTRPAAQPAKPTTPPPGR